MPKQNYRRLILALCLAAGLLYNSWPLGYVLDAPTARSGLASDLELAGHPYYWLFILGDVATGLVLLLVSWVMYFKMNSSHSKSWALACLGLALFGVFTMVCALLPSECTVTPLLRCGADHGHGLGLDAATSSVAAAGLLLSLVSFGLSGRSANLRYLTRVTLAGWAVSGLVFVSAALTESRSAHRTQYAFLILSGLAIAVIGLNIKSAGQKPGTSHNRTHSAPS